MVEVYIVSADIRTIYNIDTVNQTFTAECIYKLRYNPTKNDRIKWNQMKSVADNQNDDEKSTTSNKSGGDASSTEFIPEYIPKIKFPVKCFPVII